MERAPLWTHIGPTILFVSPSTTRLNSTTHGGRLTNVTAVANRSVCSRPGVSEEYVLPVVELLYESMGPNYNFSSPSCPECPSPVDVATELRFFRIARMLQAKPAGLPGYDRRGATRPARPRHRPDQPPDLIVSATLGVIAAITIAIALRHLRT